MNEKEIIAFWPITFAALGDNSLIAGSPNRMEKRFLFCDGHERFYIAEGYPVRKMQFQIRQNRLLEYFAENHLPGIHPFCRTLSGDHGVLIGELFWQIKPFVPAENISRQALSGKAEYGLLWADFLLQLKSLVEKSDQLPAMPNSPFYMANFLPELQCFAERKMPYITGRLQKFEQALAPFFKWERKAESMFAHGDFHPGNILTGNGGIRAVIDWEFAGFKFPGYDMALLTGCLAMDHPDNLASPSVRAFLSQLHSNDFISPEAWDLLPQMVAATRMGWLGEWLLLEDEALVRQEMELLSILLEK